MQMKKTNQPNKRLLGAGWKASPDKRGFAYQDPQTRGWYSEKMALYILDNPRTPETLPAK
jgi:hypothetical protein